MLRFVVVHFFHIIAEKISECKLVKKTTKRLNSLLVQLSVGTTFYGSIAIRPDWPYCLIYLFTPGKQSEK